jgi:hypothetical protein
MVVKQAEAIQAGLLPELRNQSFGVGVAGSHVDAEKTRAFCRTNEMGIEHLAMAGNAFGAVQVRFQQV